MTLSCLRSISILTFVCFFWNCNRNDFLEDLEFWKRTSSEKQTQLLYLATAQAITIQDLLNGPVPIDQENELTNYQIRLYNSTQGIIITGYFSKPEGNGPFPLIVMMHGCGGAYSYNDPGRGVGFLFTEWAARGKNLGYATLLLDSFTPRNAPQNQCGNGPGTGTSEVTDRPTDAYAALDYVRRSSIIDSDKIVLLGWSHGGSSVLSTVDTNSTLVYRSIYPKPFRAVVSFYPGCGLNNAFGGIVNGSYLPFTHTKILAAELDPLYTSGYCDDRIARAQTLGASVATGNSFTITVYPNAHHSFDQANAVNSQFDANDVAAKPIADQEAVDFFQTHNP
ncbi:dienelactone hydrolase [Leptospira gomenensis]|uniref:Dienelactone hydrolase n=1 Tax=Leptospira gomenensis TaxID=2484974 RepID=A0A5F1YD51_9LEPT|nr:prolyl oligopeptidase family serine peptidase [Leptospira gomenensis]TGK36004.1 dienelactone hydrolase [Leptospira gomenensis]TGK39964.1 dienelactone hydrolase [Leptospira gomenensis]TGK51414.1 dienelactone hydrolase [Leptospira gomenensis]TGK64911.1 dienelactone hydrolase [Leptospira gomenensis]